MSIVAFLTAIGGESVIVLPNAVKANVPSKHRRQSSKKIKGPEKEKEKDKDNEKDKQRERDGLVLIVVL